MGAISCRINGQEVTCEVGTTILESAKASGILIPTLCYLKDLNQPAACRICMVEIAGMPRLMAACSTKVTEGMEIETESEAVVSSRKRTLDLLGKRHRMDCEYCPDYTFCELHALIRQYGLDDRKYSQVYHERNADESSASIVRDSSKCIRCRRCVGTCQKQGVEAISALYRAEQTVTGAIIPMAETNCVGCGQCVRNCPTGALFIKDETDLLWRAKNNKKKIIFGIMPQTATEIGKFFGEQEETNQLGKLTAIANKVGVEAVYDLTGLDMEGVQSAAACVAKKKEQQVSPIFVATCAAAKVHYSGCEQLVPVRSTEQIFHDEVTREYESKGIRKEDLFVVYISACASEKAAHSSDAVLTTTELYQWMLRACVSRFTLDDVWKNTKAVEAERLVCQRDTSKYADFREALEKTLEESYHWKTDVQKADGFNQAKSKMESAEVILVHACLGGCKNGGGQFRLQGVIK